MTKLRTPTKIAAQAHLFRKRADEARRHGRFATSRSLLSEAVALERALHEEKRCKECGRELTDPMSIELGIGPECRKRKEGNG